MTSAKPVSGVIAAALTPLKSDFSLALADLPPFLAFLAERGAHGALLLGTTGEGPSFSPEERIELVRAALPIRESLPDFRLLVGAGTPSLEETIAINKAVFELGVDGVVVLPPYFFRKASEEGLLEWYSLVIRRSVPASAAFLIYHIPAVSGISISLDLLARLRDAFPEQIFGIKDSSTDPDFARQLGQRFGGDLLIFSGTDSLFSLALEYGASGSITAMSNLRSPDLRIIWDVHNDGLAGEAQCSEAVDAALRLQRARWIMDRYPPNPPLYKALLARIYGFPLWPVRPPLLPHPEAQIEAILAEAVEAVEGFAE